SFDADKLVIYSGALQDLNLVINSALRVVQNVPKTKFVILGDHRSHAKSKNAWEKIVHDRGLDEYFVFLGKKPREEVPKYLLCADICVDSFPDEPYYAAAHPIKLLEYGSCGKPVVATKVEETEKIVKDKVYGFLSKPDDPSEFADHLITLLNSSDLCKKMGLEFSKYVRTNFNWDKISLDLETILSN
ncbi:MAG: glycosyltransferase family 4 protein, partial [Nitrosotalea sp.]